MDAQKTLTVPVFRIFDYQKAIEFYVGWLGFKIDWEHRFDDNSPIYMQISKDGIILHLSEHHGDCSPGSRVYIETTGVKEYHEELISKNYKYNKPGLEIASWNALCMDLIDPFSNKLTITEKIK